LDFENVLVPGGVATGCFVNPLGGFSAPMLLDFSTLDFSTAFGLMEFLANPYAFFMCDRAY
jgi:hypothetical protein